MTRSTRSGPGWNAKVRCAIYTRKSSEEGLDQEFNSLQAQREVCDAFITSQRQEGWACVRRGYDDGGLKRGQVARHLVKKPLIVGFPFSGCGELRR